MKKLLIALAAIFALSLTACNDSASKKVKQETATEATAGDAAATPTEFPEMTFDRVSHDFGTISEGEKVTTTFAFTNTGKTDLIIVDARGSCGCTVPDYPKNTPIAPGQTGEIVVSFDSSNKPNLQQKTVTISANTQLGRETLRIKANVSPDPVKQKQREEAAKARQQSN